MKERTINLKPFIKPDDPDEIAVFAGASNCNEIRFYLNQTQYVIGIKSVKGIDVKIMEEEFDQSNPLNTQSKQAVDYPDENLFEILKENFQDCKWLLLKSSIVFLAIFLLAISLVISVKDLMLTFFVCMFLYFLLCLGRVFLIEVIESEYLLRSKHACEHKLINFLETFKRLPQNMDEINKTSRFTPECGCSELVKEIGARFFISFLASIFAIVIYEFCIYLGIDRALEIFFAAFFIGKFTVMRLINNEYFLDIVELIQDYLTYIMQIANTTEDYDEYDALLAYCVAREWLKLVYPQYYDKKADTFLENCKLNLQ